MLKFWSEVRSARLLEMTADVATWAWVALWAVVGWWVFADIAGYADAGRTLASGGTGLQAAGVNLGTALGGIPIVGASIQGLATNVFRTAGQPLIFVGSALEELVLLIARLLAILVVAVALVPWLTRYVPWRARRLTDLRAAHRAIRRAPADVTKAGVERLLASRALHRLSYSELLSETPDPFGDFISGRYERLARAELASVGLRP
ncbi:MAG TPA: hypothetical protein VKC59_02415 [Candidatus Limnocylindrales bacterium]|nr:hypothetical protein [Candidatus Limnocylindrales bacterium]